MDKTKTQQRVNTKKVDDLTIDGASKPAPQEKQKGRFRLFLDRVVPTSVIGISLMLVAMGVGVAFSGASFYAYYNSRLTANEEAVGKFVEGFDQQFNDAAGSIDELRDSSVAQIRSELAPLGSFVDQANGVASLPAAVGGSVWSLETRDANGRQKLGSAVAVAGHESGTAFLTSYSLVASSAKAPSPEIALLKGDQVVTATMWSWDPETDLAVLTISESVDFLKFADNTAQVSSVGSIAFGMSGVGGQGSTAVPGFVVDASDAGIQHTVAKSQLLVGGPLVNGAGELLAIVSDSYEPFGIDTGQVRQAPDVQQICSKLLKCSETEGILLGTRS